MSKKVRRYLIKYNNRKEEATGREVDLLRQSGIKVKVLKELTGDISGKMVKTRYNEKDEVKR